MTDSLGALLDHARSDGRVCPLPQVWNRFFELLPNKRRIGAGWEPPLPLILGAWHYTSDADKRERFLLHIRWAADHGALEAASKFIRILTPDQWHCEVS